LLEVKKEWDSQARITTQDKSKYDELQKKLTRILESSLSDDDLRHLAATCGTLAVRAKNRNEFTNAVLAFMERTFIDSGDRDNLVKLLSTRCQLRIWAYDDIEFYLAIEGRKLTDPILVLGEAFTKCQVPEVRHDIAGAVRRGFVGLGIRGKDDGEFVSNAMQWYEKEKDHLTVNGDYWKNTMLMPAEVYDVRPEYYENVEKNLAVYRMGSLFEKKPSGK
jgi:hypothetical protein